MKEKRLPVLAPLRTNEGEEELEARFRKHAIPAVGRDAVRRALRDAPLRRVSSSKRNTVVRFASRRMGVTVQAESATVELSYLKELESNPAVWLFICQPLQLPVRDRDANGVLRAVHRIFDYLVVDDDGFWVVECKSTEEVERDLERPYPRFAHAEKGRYEWPAAKEAVGALGLRFRLFVSSEINPIWTRNITFLTDFFSEQAPEGVDSLIVCVRENGCVSLPGLFDRGFTREAVYWSIVHGKVWFDLDRLRLFEQDGESLVHDCEARMLAVRNTDPQSVCWRLPVPEVRFGVVLECGSLVSWDSVQWRVANRGSQCITLQSCADEARFVPLPLDQVEKLLESGQLSAPVDAQRQARAVRHRELLASVSDKMLYNANERIAALRKFRETGCCGSQNRRTLLKYERWAAEGLEKYGSEIAGLYRRRGPRVGARVIVPHRRQALEAAVKESLDDNRGGRVAAHYKRYVAKLTEDSADRPVSETTFRREVKSRNRLSQTALVSKGRRAEHQVAPPVARSKSGFPSHGDRPFERAHADHGLVDCVLCSAVDGTVLGRPWLTLMIDECTRMPLAIVVGFDAPSRYAMSALLWDCAHRFARLPDQMVVDQGSDLLSNHTDAVLSRLAIHKQERRVSSPRDGTVMERLFGLSNTEFIHELRGQTRHAARARDLSSSHAPARSAVWTLSDFVRALDRWMYGVYPGLVHGTLGARPREVFERLLERDGERVSRYVTCDDALRFELAVEVNRKTRVVGVPRGIVVDYLPYWHDDFEFADVAGTKVKVRIEPRDVSSVYVWLKRSQRWVTAHLSCGDADLSGRSWRQVRLAVEELKQRRRIARGAYLSNAREVGKHLLDTDHHGEKLTRQQARDREFRSAQCSLGAGGSAGSRKLHLVHSQEESSSTPEKRSDAVQGTHSYSATSLSVVSRDRTRRSGGERSDDDTSFYDGLGYFEDE